MADIDSLVRQARAAVRALDSKSKAKLRRRMAANQGLLNNPQSLKKRADRVRLSTLTKLDRKYGVRVKKSDLQALDSASIQRLVRAIRAELGD